MTTAVTAHRIRVVIASAAFVLVLAGPLLLSSYWTGLLTQMLILAMLAMSLDVLLGYTGLPSLGHAGIFCAAAYTVAVLSTKYGAGFAASVAGGLAGGVVLSALTGLFVSHVRDVYFLMITLALGMVNTYFHRQDVIRPHALAFGVGYEGAFGGIDGRSALGKAPAQYWPVLCPVPGQQNVGLNYGKEAPDACPGDAAAGYPITVYWGTSNLKIKSHSLKAVPPGPLPKGAVLPEVDCYLYDPAQGVEAGMTKFQQCVCLIAKDPLKPNTAYEVSLAVDVDGKPWSKTWRFSTGAGGGGVR